MAPKIRHAFGKLPRPLRVHMELARPAGVPIVWSHVLAAWGLCNGVVVPTLLIVLLAMTLIWLGGAYLNDAMDAPIDRKRRRARPIVHNEISAFSVYILGSAFIGIGLFLMWPEGWGAFGMTALLAALAVGYNVSHFRFKWSPLILGGCRAMIYLTVAIAAARRVDTLLLGWAMALLAFETGRAFVCNTADRNWLRRALPGILLFIPALAFIYPLQNPTRWLLTGVFGLWILAGLVTFFTPRFNNPRAGRTILTSGLCLVDFLAVSQIPDPLLWQGLVFASFIASLALFWMMPGTARSRVWPAPGKS